MKTEEDLFKYLEELGIETKTYEHVPVYTVEQGESVCVDIPGCDCKNLFLKDKKSKFWLVVAKVKTKIDLKKLSKYLLVKNLHFVKEDELIYYLGVRPGTVTPFGLINDDEHVVNVVLESDLFSYEFLTFHPMRNNATTVISTVDFMRFLKFCGNSVWEFDFNDI